MHRINLFLLFDTVHWEQNDKVEEDNFGMFSRLSYYVNDSSFNFAIYRLLLSEAVWGRENFMSFDDRKPPFDYHDRYVGFYN